MTLKRSEMKRSAAPMRRTEMKRTGPIKAAVKAEPKKRMRKCSVKTCRALFEPRSMTHKACSPECAQAQMEADKAAKLRKERQEGLAKLKTKKAYEKEAQVAFNAYVRERDKDKPCICCGRTSIKQYMTGSNWDCGHYRSTGSAPHLRFHEDNAHRQLVYCNRDRSGNAVEYRKGLIARIGLARVEAVEADYGPAKWTIDDLKAIKAKYVRML